MSVPSPESEESKDYESFINVEPQSSQAQSIIDPEPTHNSVDQQRHNGYLDVPLETAFRNNSTDTLSNISTYSTGNENERMLPPDPRAPNPYGLPRRSKSWRTMIYDAWIENKGCALVMLAQFFGAFMGAATRILETDGAHGQGMHPYQILFVRMVITVTFSSFYMWYARVPDAPWGKPPLRGLLVMRGVGGFFGVWGFYYSLMYLSLAEAIVISFLGPILACILCACVLREPFTRTQQICAIISLVGVVLIARPVSFFTALHSSSASTTSTTPPVSGRSVNFMSANNTTTDSLEHHPTHKVTALQRVFAVGYALLGVVGSAAAFTSIRWIGSRAHPLISVNYFSILCTLVSTVCLAAIPGINFRLPSNIAEWSLLLSLGASGFVMQFLLTAGLAYNPGAARAEVVRRQRVAAGMTDETEEVTEKAGSTGGSRATTMLYTNMLFGLIFDRIIWGISPSPMSWAGSALILASTMWVALKNEDKKKKGGNKAMDVRDNAKNEEEGRGLMAAGNDVAEGSDSPREELREWREVELRVLR